MVLESGKITRESIDRLRARLGAFNRPRQYGVSHFGVRNRAWVAFQDLLAVRWMQSRILRYEVEESS